MKADIFQVLLFYKYLSIENPEEIRVEQRNLCEAFNLLGRIIIAKEGINGTLEGKKEDTEKYIACMNNSKYFSGIVYKKSAGTGQAFPKLSVKVRNEIVTTGMPTLNPSKLTGKHLNASELHAWFQDKKEFYIVDMRNDYEYASGYFQDSIFSGIHNFYDLPKVLPTLSHLKNKTIVTVCTGGVRCEKASGFLLENGFISVYQLQDGIQTYMELYPNEEFKGKLYVFDNRLTLAFNANDSKHVVVGKCLQCGISCDNYVNCAYDTCHKHYICCVGCLDKETSLAFCNKDCKKEYATSPQSNSVLY